ncbi:MAG: portal protein [Pseudomonadota bacterium]
MAESEFKEPTAEAKSRLEDARIQKRKIEEDLREAYFFTAPLKEREMVSNATGYQNNGNLSAQQGDLMSALGIEVAQDFASHILGTFMPPNFDWCRRGPGIYTRADDWAEVEDDAAEGDKEILKAVRAASLDSVAYQTFYPDAACGTCAMWIDDDIPGANPVMRAVPARELEINVGPLGEIDDRFWVQKHKQSRLKQVIGADLYEKLPKKLKNQPSRKKDGTVEVVWGFWRSDDYAAVRWEHVIMVEKVVYHHERLEGLGSCPLIVGRFNPDAGCAWGTGPTISALPWLRLHDVQAEEAYDTADRAGSPPFAYPDDGVTNFEDGIEKGKAYPMAPGSGRDFVNLNFARPEGMQAQMFEGKELEHLVRRMHFVDEPEQLGKTPVSAAEFVEETVKKQKRIGPVGQKFWEELPVGIFQRFRFLLEARGIVEPLTPENGSGIVSTQAYNPAVKSQEMQEVQIAARFMEMARALFPMESQAAIDGFQTLEEMQKKMAAELVKMRGAEEAKQLMAQLVAGAAQGAAGGQEAA